MRVAENITTHLSSTIPIFFAHLCSPFHMVHELSSYLSRDAQIVILTLVSCLFR